MTTSQQAAEAAQRVADFLDGYVDNPAVDSVAVARVAPTPGAPLQALLVADLIHLVHAAGLRDRPLAPVAFTHLGPMRWQAACAGRAYQVERRDAEAAHGLAPYGVWSLDVPGNPPVGRSGSLEGTRTLIRHHAAEHPREAHQ